MNINIYHLIRIFLTFTCYPDTDSQKYIMCKNNIKNIPFLFGMYCFYLLDLQRDNETLTESKQCNYENYSNYTTRKMDGVSSIDSEK